MGAAEMVGFCGFCDTGRTHSTGSSASCKAAIWLGLGPVPAVRSPCDAVEVIQPLLHALSAVVLRSVCRFSAVEALVRADVLCRMVCRPRLDNAQCSLDQRLLAIRHGLPHGFYCIGSRRLPIVPASTMLVPEPAVVSDSAEGLVAFRATATVWAGRHELLTANLAEDRRLCNLSARVRAVRHSFPPSGWRGSWRWFRRRFRWTPPRRWPHRVLLKSGRRRGLPVS